MKIKWYLAMLNGGELDIFLGLGLLMGVGMYGRLNYLLPCTLMLKSILCIELIEAILWLNLMVRCLAFIFLTNYLYLISAMCLF